MDGAIRFAIDVPRAIELAFVGFILCLLQQALLAFFRLALAEQFVQMLRASFELLDELVVEPFEVLVLCRGQSVKEAGGGAGTRHPYTLEDFVYDGFVCACCVQERFVKKWVVRWR